MPNHVKNVLKFKHLKPDDVNLLVNMIAEKRVLPVEVGVETYIIDFDKIIPEPKTKEECPKECVIKSAREAHISEDKDRPWFDWYTWHNKYWGTKWNAYDAHTIIGKSYVTFIFNTAWAAPYPVIEKLFLLGYDFDYRYADEDIGNNCGYTYYQAEYNDTQYGTEEDLDDPEKFARNLWRRY